MDLGQCLLIFFVEFVIFLVKNLDVLVGDSGEACVNFSALC